MMSNDVYDGFSDLAKKVMRFVNSMGLHYNQKEISPIIVLDCLVVSQLGVAYAACKKLLLLPDRLTSFTDRIRKEVALLKHENELPRGQLPLSQKAQELIGLAREDVQSLGHDALGPEHLFLGLLRCEDEIIANIFDDFSLKPLLLRQVALQLMRGVPPDDDNPEDDRSGDLTIQE